MTRLHALFVHRFSSSFCSSSFASLFSPLPSSSMWLPYVACHPLFPFTDHCGHGSFPLPPPSPFLPHLADVATPPRLPPAFSSPRRERVSLSPPSDPLRPFILRDAALMRDRERDDGYRRVIARVALSLSRRRRRWSLDASARSSHLRSARSARSRSLIQH